MCSNIILAQSNFTIRLNTLDCLVEYVYSNINGLCGYNLSFQVSPPYDTTGTTALTAANLLFEMLSVLPGVIYKD